MWPRCSMSGLWTSVRINGLLSLFELSRFLNTRLYFTNVNKVSLKRNTDASVTRGIEGESLEKHCIWQQIKSFKSLSHQPSFYITNCEPIRKETILKGKISLTTSEALDTIPELRWLPFYECSLTSIEWQKKGLEMGFSFPFL